MRCANVGVIGHVDHGKTALVRALTGIETDRLAEEKRRGMSIVPGYAWLDFDEGSVELIDVPGHEQFVRMMVAGANGIDAVLLVVDGCEGPMPQTREHLTIASMLGIARGVVAVTKSDRLGDGERRAASERLRGLLRGSFLEHAPCVFTSALDGEGVAALAGALHALLRAAPADARANGGPPRGVLAVDRVFAMAGAGTVVTGTLRDGPVQAGETLRLLPGGREVTVRRVQVHGRDRDEAQAGQRTALNLRGIGRHEIVRGDLLAGMHSPAAAATLLDVELIAATEAAGLVDGETLRLLIGTAEVGARLRLLDRDALRSGDTACAQLCCEHAIACAPMQRFVLRRASPAATLGGGRVLAFADGRHRRRDARILARLAVLAYGDAGEKIVARIGDAGGAGVEIAELARHFGELPAKLRAAIDAQSAILRIGERAFAREALERTFAGLERELDSFHRAHPERVGMPLAALRARLSVALDGRGYAAVLEHARASLRIEIVDGCARRRGHDPLSAIGEAGRERARLIETRFRRAGLAPPDPGEVVGADARGEALLRLLIERGSLHRMPAAAGQSALVFHRDAVAAVRQRLGEAWPPPARFTLSQARELLGSTRKFVVPLMEYLDDTGFTRRFGDRRAIAEPPGVRTAEPELSQRR